MGSSLVPLSSEVNNRDDSKTWHQRRTAWSKSTTLLFSYLLSARRRRRGSAVHKGLKRPCKGSTLGQSSTRLPSGSRGTCCPHAPAPSRDLGAEQMRGFGFGASLPAAAGAAEEVGSHWHPAAPCVAAEAPFPILPGETARLEGRERCMSWSDCSGCFPWLHQLPVCLHLYHQLQPKKKHLQMLPDINTSSGALLEVSYPCQPAASTWPSGGLLEQKQHLGVAGTQAAPGLSVGEHNKL